jgi:hypothetical protein
MGFDYPQASRKLQGLPAWWKMSRCRDVSMEGLQVSGMIFLSLSVDEALSHEIY